MAMDPRELLYCLNDVPLCHELEEVGKRILETGYFDTDTLSHIHDKAMKKIWVNSVYGMCTLDKEDIKRHIKRQLIEANGGNTMNYDDIISEWTKIGDEYRKQREEKREEKRKMIREYQERSLYFAIRDIIFNGPATIVIWQDGTKTVVKCQDGEVYDKEKAIAMAISKRALGNSFNDVFGIAERFKKEKESLEKELNKAQEQWNQMSDKHKLGKHRPKSAVELEKKITMLKEKIERCDTYIKKYS